MTEEQRQELDLAPGQPGYETPGWMARLAAERRAFQEKLDERKGLRIPSEDPDYENEGEAWPAWTAPDRDAILQAPRPEIRPAPEVLHRAAGHGSGREAAI